MIFLRVFIFVTVNWRETSFAVINRSNQRQQPTADFKRSLYEAKYEMFYKHAMCVRGYIQKFPDWVNNKHSLRSNTKCYGVKPTRLTQKIEIQLHLVAESCITCSSRSRRPVRKLLDIPSYTASCNSQRKFCRSVSVNFFFHIRVYSYMEHKVLLRVPSQ
jgi:hypothetical protein